MNEIIMLIVIVNMSHVPCAFDSNFANRNFYARSILWQNAKTQHINAQHTERLASQSKMEYIGAIGMKMIFIARRNAIPI